MGEYKRKKIDEISYQLNKDLVGKDVVFVAVLNGAFLFASEVYRNIHLDSKITFVKLSSYEGTSSSGNVNRLLGVNEDLEGKCVVLLEDIIDTGETLKVIYSELEKHNPSEILLVSLLFKKDACKHDFKVDYLGFEVPNHFLVGFGLDYEGYGRNLNNLYTLVEEN